MYIYVIIKVYALTLTVDYVLALWKLAQEADFSPTELESLREELHHFEARIAKMHYMEAEMRAADLRRDPDEDGDDHHLPKLDTEGRRIMGGKMKKHADEVDRMREHIERTIAARHSEL